MADFYQRVKILSTLTKKSLSELSVHIGVTPGTLTQKLKVGKYKLEQLRELADFFGASYHCEFIPEEGGVGIIDDNYESFGTMILYTIRYRDMPLKQVGDRIGVTAQAVSNKLKVGKFTEREVIKYCEVTHFVPHFWFELNGTKIE